MKKHHLIDLESPDLEGHTMTTRETCLLMVGVRWGAQAAKSTDPNAPVRLLVESIMSDPKITDAELIATDKLVRHCLIARLVEMANEEEDEQ